MTAEVHSGRRWDIRQPADQHAREDPRSAHQRRADASSMTLHGKAIAALVAIISKRKALDFIALGQGDDCHLSVWYQVRR